MLGARHRGVLSRGGDSGKEAFGGACIGVKRTRGGYNGKEGFDIINKSMD